MEYPVLRSLPYKPVLFQPPNWDNVEEMTHIWSTKPEEGLLNNAVNLILSRQLSYIICKENKANTCHLFPSSSLRVFYHKKNYIVGCPKLHYVMKQIPLLRNDGSPVFSQLVDQHLRNSKPHSQP